MPVTLDAPAIEEWLGTDGSDLPALPRVAAELTSLVSDPDAAYDQLSEIVMYEPVLAARVLRLVNSAYFGLSQKVTDIRHAVLLLGFRTVRTVALTASVLSAFKEVASQAFDYGRFWRHSISAAAVCRTLAKRCGTFEAETAFSLGLLHDVGKLVLVHYRMEDAERVIANAEARGLSFVESEQQLLPMTHAELGAWLAQRWGLPPVLADGLAAHHNLPGSPFPLVRDPSGTGRGEGEPLSPSPLAGEGRGEGDRTARIEPLLAAIQFANYLCVVKGITTSGSFGQADLRRDVWLALGISIADLPPLIDVVNAEVKTAEDLLRHA